MIKAVIFDFGGVLAEEGFREGLKAIARSNGLDPDVFFKTGEDLIYETGYVTGMARESDYWKAVRKKTGISGKDNDLREEILRRFTLRQWLIRHVKGLRASGMVTAILSDQTNWLEEIANETNLYDGFDYVFNSFRIKKGKKDPSVFKDVCNAMGLNPSEVIFVDDNPENIKRASSEGLNVIHFKDKDDFLKGIRRFIHFQ